MRSVSRPITWFAVSVLAIAPTLIALTSLNSWSPKFSLSQLSLDANHSPASIEPEAFRNIEERSSSDFSAMTVTPSPSESPFQETEPSAIDGAPRTDQSFDCDNPQTQQAMNHCAYLDYQEADEALNQTYQDLMAVIPDRRQDKLVEAEQAWITYRDRTCEFERSLVEGGSMESLIYHSCMAQLTHEQTLWLETYLNEYQ